MSAAPQRGESVAPARAAIGAQLETMLASKRFAGSPRIRDLLAYVVRLHLDDQADRINEYDIGLSVFGRAEDFDPANDTIVRTTAARLRKQLAAYYEEEGANAPILIEIPKGHYVPRFTFRTVEAPAPEPLPRAKVAVRKTWWVRLCLAAALLVLVVVTAAVLRLAPTRSRSNARGATAPRPRRLFAPATSEGGSPIYLQTGQVHGRMLLSPDGENLYALSAPDFRSITVIGVRDLRIRRKIELPAAMVEQMIVSPDGKRFYCGLASGEVVAIDIASGRVAESFPVGGQVFGLAATPDGRKLFLAMEYKGLKRLDLQTRDVRLLSPLACPKSVAVDPAGKYVYVGYECGGPGGRSGHDTVDVYDAATEQSVHVIGGDLPMVGGRALISPNGDIVLLDGHDACNQARYDHVGCEKVPSWVFHVWRASDRRVLYSPTFDRATPASFFPDGNRVLLGGPNPEVWDWTHNTIIERASIPDYYGRVLTRAGDRLFGAGQDTPGLLVFDAEKETCLAGPGGLVNFYSGDGTFDDSVAAASITPFGAPGFAPGRMGQAFRLDGKASYLRATYGSAWCPHCGGVWSMSLSVKFASVDGDMTILERGETGLVPELRLHKSRQNRIVLDSAATAPPIAASPVVEPDRWYHIVVSTGGESRALYVGGVLQGWQAFTGRGPSGEDITYIGATRDSRNFLAGLVDELAVYSRPLSPEEVAALARGCR